VTASTFYPTSLLLKNHPQFIHSLLEFNSSYKCNISTTELLLIKNAFYGLVRTKWGERNATIQKEMVLRVYRSHKQYICTKHITRSFWPTISKLKLIYLTHPQHDCNWPTDWTKIRSEFSTFSIHYSFYWFR
jgi:hypothetical protein